MSQTFILGIHWWFHDVQVGFLFQKWWHLHIFPTPVPNVPTYDILMTNRPKVRVICTPLYMKDLWGIPKVRWIFMNLHFNGSMSPQKCIFEALCFAISLVLSNMAYKYLSVAFLQMIKEGILGSILGEVRESNGQLAPRRQTFRVMPVSEN